MKIIYWFGIMVVGFGFAIMVLSNREMREYVKNSYK